MLKNFKNGYQVSGSSEIAKTEKNDCAVRAVANACDVNYDQAHKFCTEMFDRQKGKGTTGFSLLLKMNTEMVFDEVGQFNPKYKHKKVAYTVKEFAQRFNKGNYILAVNKHALAIKNGVVVDNGNYQVGGYRRVVESAFMVA